MTVGGVGKQVFTSSDKHYVVRIIVFPSVISPALKKLFGEASSDTSKRQK